MRDSKNEGLCFVQHVRAYHVHMYTRVMYMTNEHCPNNGRVKTVKRIVYRSYMNNVTIFDLLRV